MEIQVASHRAARGKFVFPDLCPGQVNEVHALGHDQQVARRIGHGAQLVQALCHVGRRAEVDRPFHAQELQLRAFGQRVGLVLKHHETPIRCARIKPHRAHRRA
ncbi:hypothetical protein D3C72_2023710 [compost metagenome]